MIVSVAERRIALAEHAIRVTDKKIDAILDEEPELLAADVQRWPVKLKALCYLDRDLKETLRQYRERLTDPNARRRYREDIPEILDNLTKEATS